jgi:hypothetical protein
MYRHIEPEDGPDRGFRNVGKTQSDAGEIPKRTYINEKSDTTQRTPSVPSGPQRTRGAPSGPQRPPASRISEHYYCVAECYSRYVSWLDGWKLGPA